MNYQQGQPGRQVWYRYSDRFIRNERHLWASVNYIHFNPVKHGYVERMEDWPWSSVHGYLESLGQKGLKRMMILYPIGDYGKGWDW
jgi:putative transposase